MKETCLRLLRYNAWANALFISLLESLSEEQADAEIVSSFSSVRKTVHHLWGAEDIWLQRLQHQENPVWRVAQFEGSFAEALAQWAQTSQALIQFAEGLSEEVFPQRFGSTNLQGQPTNDAFGEVLEHIAIHGSYHRGQLVTMLRQLGCTEIPRTDFIAYARSL
jgi:uncharacterized damage-inducible protein DinB